MSKWGGGGEYIDVVDVEMKGEKWYRNRRERKSNSG